MYRVPTLFALVVCVALARDSTAQNAPALSAVDEMRSLSETWMQAAQDHDTATLLRLMADDFVLVHPSQDKVTARPQWLDALRRIQMKHFRYEHMRVTLHGDNLALVSSRLVIDALMDGRPWPAPVTAVIDVWEKRAGHWLVVSRYAVRPEELQLPTQPAPVK